jgi:glycosyltransferase involved in cell wall biosynthesis
MKICLINNLFQPYLRGGAERIVEIIAAGLEESGHDVFIISTRPYFSAPILPPGQKAYFLPSLYFHLAKVPLLLRYFWHLYDNLDWINYFRVKRILKSELPDIVITNNLKGLSLLVPIALSSLNIKHLHILHDIQLLHPSGLMLAGQEQALKSIAARLYQSLNRWIFKSTDAVISPSSWLLNLHVQHNFFPGSKHRIIRNPVLIDHGQAADSINKNPDRSKVIFLFVGQLVGHKGIDLLIQAFQELTRLYPDKLSLVIVGQGKFNDLARQASQNNRQIEYLGAKHQLDVIFEMAKCDCLVVPSVCYENSPTVIYEALSIGLPVIASEIGGITELVAELGGCLFKPNDKDDLIRVMSEIIENPGILARNKLNAKIDIRRYSVENYIKSISELF